MQYPVRWCMEMGSPPVEFEMPLGTYTLEISPRESGCNIDAIVFTKVSE